jgi:hypothetical protein
MKTMTMKAHVGTDGMLHLDMPVDYKNTDVEVTLNIRAEDEVMNEPAQPEGPTDDDCCIDAQIEEDRRNVVFDL